MKKILIIEDNAEIAENIEEILTLSDYQVLVAHNGKDGADQAVRYQPDLIVCDVMMPELDGFGVLRILSKRPQTAHIPFIFLTAKSEKEDFRKGMNLGADDYITKPFDDVELLDVIELRLKKQERLMRLSGNGDTGQSFFQEQKGMDAIRQLSENRETRYYRKRDVIYEEDEYPKQLYYLKKGTVKTYKSTDFGKELIFEVYKPGSFLGFIPLIQNERYAESAAAMQDCEIAIIPKDDFLKLLHNNNHVSAQLVKMLANNVVEKEEQLLRLAYDSVRRKVADALLSLATEYDQNNHAQFAILREDLASMIGTAKETVIRTLSEFKDDGYITMKGSKITILDKEGLEDMPF